MIVHDEFMRDWGAAEDLIPKNLSEWLATVELIGEGQARNLAAEWLSEQIAEGRTSNLTATEGEVLKVLIDFMLAERNYAPSRSLAISNLWLLAKDVNAKALEVQRTGNWVLEGIQDAVLRFIGKSTPYQAAEVGRKAGEARSALAFLVANLERSRQELEDLLLDSPNSPTFKRDRRDSGEEEGRRP